MQVTLAPGAMCDFIALGNYKLSWGAGFDGSMNNEYYPFSKPDCLMDDGESSSTATNGDWVFSNIFTDCGFYVMISNNNQND
jgi:hypothetical protein